MNYEAFQRLNYGIFIVGVAWDGKDYGCLVNSFAQGTGSFAVYDCNLAHVSEYGIV